MRAHAPLAGLTANLLEYQRSRLHPGDEHAQRGLGCCSARPWSWREVERRVQVGAKQGCQGLQQ